MDIRRLARLVPLVALVIGLLPAPATAAPLLQANLLANPGFESGKDGWLQWWAEIAKPADGYNYAFVPSWNIESLINGAAPEFVLAGDKSMRIMNSWDPWYAGVKQVVSVPAGSLCASDPSRRMSKMGFCPDVSFQVRVTWQSPAFGSSNSGVTSRALGGLGSCFPSRTGNNFPPG